MTRPFIIHLSSFIILAGAFYLILRTYVLLFLFSHDLGGTWMPLYQWIRDTRLGEVTIFPGAFPRIFLPSMVLLFPALLLAGSRMTQISRTDDADTQMPHPTASPIPHRGEGSRVLAAVVFGGSIGVLIVSLSRSYWIGLLALLAIGVLMLVRALIVRDRSESRATVDDAQLNISPFRAKRRNGIRGVVMGGLATFIALGVAVGVVRLPYPTPLTTAGLGETFAARFQQDAAVGNRWQELGPLRDAIARHSIFGNGFGAAVTYETKDPRTLAAYPDGKYTTTAFEWGYLDDLLERGLIGLLVEFWLLGSLIWYGFRKIFSPPPTGRGSERGWGNDTAAIAFGLLAIAIVHVTSPYLNHPLGIGMIVLLFAAVAPTTPRTDRKIPPPRCIPSI